MRRFTLPILTLLLASGIAATGPSAGQSVLESRTGAVRVWDSSSRPVDVPVGAGRIVRAGVAAEGGYVVAGEDPERADLFFMRNAGGQSTELPVPPLAAGAERARPVLLTRHDRLDGAVWLEGTGAGGLAVVAAVWNGTSWETLETVAPPNGRPQLAPSAAVLADGSWLAVWAGFDGTDDEIFWSRRRDGVWSAPRRVHGDNRVPDVLPALTALGGGALAAWSFYDGNDYRVRAARFDGSRWRVDPPLPGLGAGDARWQTDAGRAFLAFRSVVPEAWSAVELDLAGAAGYRVTVATADPRPPVITAGATGPPRLDWPYRPERPGR